MCFLIFFNVNVFCTSQLPYSRNPPMDDNNWWLITHRKHKAKLLIGWLGAETAVWHHQSGLLWLLWKILLFCHVCYITIVISSLVMCKVGQCLKWNRISNQGTSLLESNDNLYHTVTGLDYFIRLLAAVIEVCW